MRSCEGRAQDRLVKVLRGQGILVQSFTDLMGSGIADLLAAVPGNLPNLPPALWIEVKACDECPKKSSSPWWASCKPRDDQMGWLKEWNSVHPAGMYLKTPLGWTFVPVHGIDNFFEMPHTATVMHKEAPTYTRLVKCIFGLM